MNLTEAAGRYRAVAALLEEHPPLVEWMMGYPAGWVTDVLDSRNAALRCLGNAVVPQVAETFALGLMQQEAAA